MTKENDLRVDVWIICFIFFRKYTLHSRFIRIYPLYSLQNQPSVYSQCRERERENEIHFFPNTQIQYCFMSLIVENISLFYIGY